MDNKEIQYGIIEIPSIERPIKSIDKYWGHMDTLFETDDYSVKKIFMRKGSQSSLEYHVKKVESYYIDSGKLKVGLRGGRAKNKSVILNEGDVFHIKPGLTASCWCSWWPKVSCAARGGGIYPPPSPARTRSL